MFSEKFEWYGMLFLTSYRGRSTETRSLTLRILCKSAKIKFQIGIVSFSLRLSCQILVHRVDWKESRLGGDKLIKVKLAMALQASAGVLFLVCLVLCFWPVVPFIVSRENLRLVFDVIWSFFYRWGLWVQNACEQQ